jgi:hypothetical protein
MDLVSRAKNICLSPASEWRVIERETATPGELLLGYALPMAAIGAIASVIGSMLFLSMALIPAIIGLVVSLVTTFLLGLLIDALAPTFGGQKSQSQALKLAVYCQTPGWIAGIFRIIPFLGSFIALVAALYGIYLLYLGIPILMKSSDEKAVPYTVVIVVCAIVITMVLVAIMGMMLLGSLLM